MRVAIIDYGSGNLRSVAKAFERAANGGRIDVITDPKAMVDASHIVLPGVGAFADCMRGMESIPGLREQLTREILEKGKPMLGICVGMQMLFDEGHEHGVHAGLGWIRGKVVPLTPKDTQLKVPHMGWNQLRVRHPHPLLEGLSAENHAYFVHSYHAQCENPADVVAETEYGGPVTAVVARANITGTQFHPEKSQSTGLRILENFLRT